MQLQQMMLIVAGFIGLLLSRALSFKRADFDRRKAQAKLRKKPKKSALLASNETQADESEDIQQDPPA